MKDFVIIAFNRGLNRTGRWRGQWWEDILSLNEKMSPAPDRRVLLWPAMPQTKFFKKNSGLISQEKEKTQWWKTHFGKNVEQRVEQINKSLPHWTVFFFFILTWKFPITRSLKSEICFLNLLILLSAESYAAARMKPTPNECGRWERMGPNTGGCSG